MKISDQFINTIWNAVPVAERRAILADYLASPTPPMTAVLPEGTFTVGSVTRVSPGVVSATFAPKAKRTRKAGAKRGPTVPAAEAKTKVLAFLKANPADKFANGQIVKATGLKVPTVQNAVKSLIEGEYIYKAGERGQARYSYSKAGLKATGKPAKKATKKVNARHANGVVAQA
jgi:hypothetical protein